MVNLENSICLQCNDGILKYKKEKLRFTYNNIKYIINNYYTYKCNKCGESFSIAKDPNNVNLEKKLNTIFNK